MENLKDDERKRENKRLSDEKMKDIEQEQYQKNERRREEQEQNDQLILERDRRRQKQLRARSKSPEAQRHRRNNSRSNGVSDGNNYDVGNDSLNSVGNARGPGGSTSNRTNHRSRRVSFSEDNALFDNVNDENEHHQTDYPNDNSSSSSSHNTINRIAEWVKWTRRCIAADVVSKLGVSSEALSSISADHVGRRGSNRSATSIGSNVSTTSVLFGHVKPAPPLPKIFSDSSK